jgi:hypothetical protein
MWLSDLKFIGKVVAATRACKASEEATDGKKSSRVRWTFTLGFRRDVVMSGARTSGPRQRGKLFWVRPFRPEVCGVHTIGR